MSGGNYTPLNTSGPSDDSPTSLRGRSSLPFAISDGWLNVHSLKRSKPVVLALGVITIVTVFVGTQFTIGEGGFDFRSAGKSGIVPGELLASGGWDGGTNGVSKKWGNVSDVSQFVLGPPANSFRENLRPGVQYVTGWNAGGMTNIVMSFVHVIYTAMLSDRVAIVPPLSPDLAHIGGKPNKVPPINFGEIFDMPRLRKELNWPVLEWADVKRAAYDLPLSRETTPVPGAVMDELGCWGIRTISRKGNKDPGHGVLEMLLQLDCSYTVLPPDALALPDNYHVKVWSMVAALFPDGRKRILDNPKSSPQFPTQYGKKEWIAPDEQLAVFDDTYGVSSYVPYEWFQDFSPMWRFVASHLHFTPRLEGIADEYVRRMFGIGKDDAVPLYIVLHIRRGDWSKPCEENHPGTECAAPLSVFAARAEEVKRGLAEKYGSGSAQANVTAIVVTSDERDKKWWQSVADQGWYFVDYDKEETVKTLGRWYPSVIDSVIQSRAIGAVGVKGSTMSMMMERRVKDWNGGVATEVQWHAGKGARRRRSEEPDDEWYLDD